CQVALAPDGSPVLPAIRRGELLLARDFQRDPLPGERLHAFSRIDGLAVNPDRDGLLVRIEREHATAFIEPRLRIRDACIRVVAVSHDEGSQIGVIARREAVAEARTFYAFDIQPAR